VSSWTRLVHAVQLAEAIWRDDLDRSARSSRKSGAHRARPDSHRQQLGPPMTYAANLGRDASSGFLHSSALANWNRRRRAALQGKTDTVRMIYDMAGRPLAREVDARRSRVHAERRRNRGLLTRSARASRGLEAWIETPWSTSSGPTVGTRPPSTASWRCMSSTASSLRYAVMALHRGRIDLLDAPRA
jgi:hypothetical protein